jgi:dipeptidyl aminopeptidase/acylaminoacyl peptidase
VHRLLALVALLLVPAAACGGSGGAEQNGSGGGGNAAPDGLSLVIYKETLSNIVYAEQPPKQRYWSFAGESDKDFLQAIACAPDGKRAAYLMQSTESGIRLKISGRLETIPISGQTSGITWAPDGSKIAMTIFDTTSSANQLQIVDAESGQISTVASGHGGIGAPRWSPDGSRIVFDASDGQLNQIFVYKIGDPAAAKLKERPANAFAPDWSPDGTALVFVAQGPGEIYQLYKMNADGSNETQITTSHVTKAFPRWAPDGSLIAFAGTVVVPTAAKRPALVHNLAVFTVKPDGSSEQAITDLVNDARLGGWCVSGPWLNEDWKVSS